MMNHIGAVVKLPNSNEEFQFSRTHISILSSIDDVWMKENGLVFFPFDRNQDAIFFSETTINHSFQEKIFKYNENATKEEYETSVFLAQDAIRNSDLKKIVLARNELLPKTALSPIAIYTKAKELHPDCYTFMINVGDEIWIGASPELLMEYKNGMIKTVALAGTKLLDVPFSGKEKEEQLLVEEFVEEKLKLVGISNFNKTKGELQYGNIKHIQTKYEAAGNINEALAFLKHIHPTSAVCGLPRDKSFHFIQDYESLDRSFYSGVTGILKDQTATFFVNLRCMRLFENQIELFAGAGITIDSNPTEEWNETQHKINTIKKML